MDDLIGEFITETSESLAVLDSELVKLEQNPNDQSILGNIFRLVHTIKGTCGFLGLPRLESVAHAGENVLGKIRDGEIVVTQEAISIVLEALDRIKGLIEYLSENGSEPDGEDQELIKRLNAFADSNGAVSGAAQAASAPAPAAAPVAPTEEMFAPNENKIVSSTSQETMDELERAFAAASATLEGGVDFTKAPEVDWDAINAAHAASTSAGAAPAAAAPSAPVPTPAAAAPAAPISDKAKAKAIKQGLDTEAKDAGPVGTQQSIRVNIDVLENLMQMVGELVLTRNQLMQIVRHRDDRELKTPLHQLSQITTELQEGVMKTRMQPIGNAWSKFPRLIRDLSHELNKKIDLKMLGESTELDRQLLEMIKDPLTHMVRNSCDHGLEGPAERLEKGKSETGTVTLSAFHEGGHIVIEISDDGRGLPIDKIKKKILEKGMATEAELDDMSDDVVMQYIFKAGFSTAEQVTSVSGRGVGMDVVRTNIEKIGGTVSLSSTWGKGSTFHIKIPLTLAIVSVLLVESHNQKFAVPQLNVVELVRIGSESEYAVEHINQSRVLSLRDRLLPLISLSQVLQIPAITPAVLEDGTTQEGESYVAVLRIGTTDFGLVVDQIHDTEEIVVKPVSRVLGELEVYSGNTILGDGSVIMILDPNGLGKALGDIEKSGAQDMSGTTQASDERLANFLVFKAGKGSPKAVPLELVSRLEEIKAETVELSGIDPVVQYRGDLMRLKTLPGMEVPTSGIFEVVVFTYDGRTVGLVVEEIVDIRQAPLDITLSAQEEQYLGSIVISGKTTDVVDVGYMLKDLASEISTSGSAPPVSGLKVLLVEDSLFFRNLTVPLLKNVGYDVMAAAGPVEALGIIERGHHFDVIVTDIEMPDMDGFELARRLRADIRHRQVPIIAFTSTVSEAFRDRGAKAGIGNMILKTDREALLDAIAAQISQRIKELA
jgi:two-component system chemotaxis sensor kinase CheA